MSSKYHRVTMVLFVMALQLCGRASHSAEGKQPAFAAYGEEKIDGYFFSIRLDRDDLFIHAPGFLLEFLAYKPNKKHLDIKYSAVNLRVYDDLGGNIPVKMANQGLTYMFEDGAQGTAIGLYVIMCPKGRKPGSVEVSWLGEKKTRRFIESKQPINPSR